MRGKTTRCACGYTIDLTEAVVRFRDPSASRVAEAVRALTEEAADLADEAALPPESDAVGEAVRAASEERGMWARAARAAEVLTRRRGTFTPAEFEEALERLDIADGAAVLRALVDRGELVEREPDRYASP